MSTPRRGSRSNPESRFERLRAVAEDGFAPAPDDEPEDPRTELLHDPSRSILATNQSPDVGFDRSVNPYRGCAHGCAYCYARPSHEYLGLSAGLDFETKIFVKRDAPALLRKALERPSYRPAPLALSGVTDPYQPAERRLRVTRGCLEVLAEYRHPVCVITKGWTVTRDVDLLAELASHGAASVALSITTLDRGLQGRLEPGASSPRRRLEAIERLALANVPVGVMVAPVIPGLTDHEMPHILKAAADAGAGWAGRVLLRLPHGLRELWDDWLRTHAPERRDKVLHRLRALHAGRLYDPSWRRRQRGTGVFAEQIEGLFELARRRAGLAAEGPELSAAAFRRPQAQPSLFD